MPDFFAKIKARWSKDMTMPKEQPKVTASVDSKTLARRKTLTKKRSASSLRHHSRQSFISVANVSTTSISPKQMPSLSNDEQLFARNNDSSFPAIMPVPQIPMTTRHDSATSTHNKASRVLGLDAHYLQSAPSSRPTSSHGTRPFAFTAASDSSDDKPTSSRHDSFNSNGDASRLGMLKSERSYPNLKEDMAHEPAFSDAASQHGHSNRPVSEFAHSRQVSRDSFFALPRRRQTFTAPQGEHMSASAEHLQRARSHHYASPYAGSTSDDSSSVKHGGMHTFPDGDMATVPPFSGAYQPQALFMPHHHASATSSPVIRPQNPGSVRSFSMMPSNVMHQAGSSPTLAKLDGLKVNRRGKLLDEEGEVIGELYEGELIDCVRQKANAFGEVLDEYGRVVGRVRTLLAYGASSTPGLHTPAAMSNAGDYFGQPQIYHGSPAMTPTLDSRSIQRDDYRKYRMPLDLPPPLPIMPVAYQSACNSPMVTAHHPHRQNAVAPLDQSEEAPVAELDGSNAVEPMDSIPAFDLSDPFIPTFKPIDKTESAQQLVEQSADVVVKTVESTVKISTGEHVGSTSASLRSESIQSVVEDDTFANACENITPEINKETPSTNHTSVVTVGPRSQRVEIQDREQDSRKETLTLNETVDTPITTESAATPSEKVDTPTITESIAQPVAADQSMSAAVESLPVRLFHRPNSVQDADMVKASNAVKSVLSERPVEPAIVETTSIPESSAPQSTTGPKAAKEVRAEPQTAPTRAPPAVRFSTLPDGTLAKPSIISSSRKHPRRRDTAQSTTITTTVTTTSPTTTTRSASTSGSTSPEESTSEAESADVAPTQRKELRTSKAAPPRGILTRSQSDGSALSSSRFSAMPSVPESEPLPESPSSSNLLSPDSANLRAGPSRSLSARAAPPLPAFPRQSFTNSLPQNPFALANAMNKGGAGLQKRNTLPARPGVPPINARMAMNKSRYSINAPLVSSPLREAGKTISMVTTTSSVSVRSDISPPSSDSASIRAQSDAISLRSAPGTRSHTFFTHAGRVTVEAGDLPPSMQAKDVKVTQRPASSDGLKQDPSKEKKKKHRFSMTFGRKSNAVAAH